MTVARVITILQPKHSLAAHSDDSLPPFTACSFFFFCTCTVVFFYGGTATDPRQVMAVSVDGIWCHQVFVFFDDLNPTFSYSQLLQHPKQPLKATFNSCLQINAGKSHQNWEVFISRAELAGLTNKATLVSSSQPKHVHVWVYRSFLNGPKCCPCDGLATYLGFISLWLRLAILTWISA